MFPIARLNEACVLCLAIQIVPELWCSGNKGAGQLSVA